MASTNNSTVGKVTSFTLDHDGNVLDTFDLNVPAWVSPRNLAWQVRHPVCNIAAAHGITSGYIDLRSGDACVARFHFADGDLDFEEISGEPQ